MKYEWKNEYSVGINSIDEQHKHFFDIVNRIIDLNQSSNIQGDELFALVAELSDYAFYHLNTEEEYFMKYGYEMALPHIRIHNSFREKIGELYQALRTEGANTGEIALKTAEFAGDWLSGHILQMDKLYAQFFAEHGIK